MPVTKLKLPWSRPVSKSSSLSTMRDSVCSATRFELDRQEQLGIIAVNILALTDLSLRFSDSLIRHRGGVLNLGSLAGFLPGPGMAVYYASKAYVLSFSEALRQELAPRGVRVTTLCPG